MSSAGEITKLLDAMRHGDAKAESNLVALVYDELNRLAHRYMRHERPDHTLQPTALVNEAYLRLMGADAKTWNGRAHFFATASTVMRHILVDHAKKRAASKRAGGKQRVELDDFLASTSPRTEEMLVLDEALTQLSEWNARQGRLVEMMYFGGLTEEEAAGELGISVRTAKRDWRAARAWLHTQLSGNSK